MKHANNKVVIVIAAIFMFVLYACEKPNQQSVLPLKTVTVSQELDYNDQIPTEISTLISSLKFRLADQRKNTPPGVGAYTAEMKIKFFKIKAYTEYSDGWIIGSGMGEWGGIVFWLGKDGEYKVLKDDDLSYPIDTTTIDNRILIAQGMGGLANAHVLEISRKLISFESRVFPIEGHPIEFSVYNGNKILSVSQRTPMGEKRFFYKTTELISTENQFYSFD